MITFSVHEVNKLSFNITTYEEIATLLLLKIHNEIFFLLCTFIQICLMFICMNIT